MAGKSPLLPLLPTFRENLLALHAQVTQADIDAGAFWYQTAEKTIREWAGYAEKAPEVIAAMVAVLSPQCEWGQNLKAAEQLLMHGDITTHGPLHVSIDKAKRVLAEDITNTRNVMPTGSKVYNFSLNLAGDLSGVTIDTHMVQACHADPLYYLYPKPAGYEVYATAITLVADELAIAPAILQAILWHTWKRIHPTAPKRVARTAYNRSIGRRSTKSPRARLAGRL